MDDRSEDLFLGLRFPDPVDILEPVLERTILVGLEAGLGDAHRTGRQLTRNNEQEAG